MDREALIDYIAKRHGAEPEYLWSRWPGYAVFRHADNRKWFGVLMDVSASRLGLDGAGDGEDRTVDVLNVKVDPEDALLLRLAEDILPAYHMNKENWISVVIGGDVPDELLLELLDMSYRLTGSGKC